MSRAAKTSTRFTLAQWRARVGELYARVRTAGDHRPEAACAEFRAARDALFRGHPDSPLDDDARASFAGIRYFPYDPQWRLIGAIAPAEGEEFEIPLPADGVLRLTPAGRVHFEIAGRGFALTAFWMEGYGGGLWLPFADATSGRSTFGAGRYLFDTIKGADPGVDAHSMTLDFNYAYNPSCAYNDHWVCPLTPRENVLPVAVEAGEKAPR